VAGALNEKENKFSRKAAAYYDEINYFPNICVRTKNSLYSELKYIKDTIVCQGN